MQREQIIEESMMHVSHSLGEIRTHARVRLQRDPQTHLKNVTILCLAEDFSQITQYLAEKALRSLKAGQSEDARVTLNKLSEILDDLTNGLASLRDLEASPRLKTRYRAWLETLSHHAVILKAAAAPAGVVLAFPLDTWAALTGTTHEDAYPLASHLFRAFLQGRDPTDSFWPLWTEFLALREREWSDAQAQWAGLGSEVSLLVEELKEDEGNLPRYCAAPDKARLGPLLAEVKIWGERVAKALTQGQAFFYWDCFAEVITSLPRYAGALLGIVRCLESGIAQRIPSPLWAESERRTRRVVSHLERILAFYERANPLADRNSEGTFPLALAR